MDLFAKIFLSACHAMKKAQFIVFFLSISYFSGMANPAWSDQAEWCHPSEVMLVYNYADLGHEGISVKFDTNSEVKKCVLESIEESYVSYNEVTVFYRREAHQIDTQCLKDFEPIPHRTLISQSGNGLAIVLGGYDTAKKERQYRTFYVVRGEVICALDSLTEE